MQFLVLALLPLVVIVLLIVLIAKISTNSSRLGTLEREVKKLHLLERRVEELGAYIEALKKQIESFKIPTSRRKIAGKLKPLAGQPPQSVPAAPVQVAAVSPKQVPPKPPSRTREEWEALIGGKFLNRIGALALIIGIGFFLKYAFDNNWIGETTRVLIGAVIGFACLAGGYRTNKRGFQIFAQGLVGAGIAILYLSVYAAFNFYQLVPQWVAFILMSIVTVIAFVNGLFYNSLAEGILGWAGGFLTPFLLSTGQANEIGLFTYIVLLDAGLIGMVIKRDQWSVLEPLAFIGTWLMYITWWAEFYTDADLWLTVFFVTLFWVLFLIPDILRSRRSSAVNRLEDITSILNAAFGFLALYFLIDKDTHAWMGLTTLLMGAVYFAAFLIQQRRGGVRDDVKVRYTLAAVSLLAIATAIQFSRFDTIMVWSIEAAALVWCSKEWNEEFLRTAAMVLFGCAVFKLLFVSENGLMYSPISEFTLLFNHRALAFAVLALGMGYSGFTIERSAGTRERQDSNVLHVGWCVILFLLASSEIVDFFRYKMIDQPGDIVERLSYFRTVTFSVVWITLSLPIVLVGYRKQVVPLAVSALVYSFLAVFVAAVRGIAFDPIEYYAPVFNVRVIAILLVVTGLVLHAQFIQKNTGAYGWMNDLLSYVHVATVLLIFVLLTGETRDFFRRDIVSLVGGSDVASVEAIRLRNLQQMYLSGIWVLYSAVLMAIGIWRKVRWMRFAAIALFGVTILKIFIYDLSFLETLYRIFSFVVLGAILIAVSYAYQKYKDVIGGKA